MSEMNNDAEDENDSSASDDSGPDFLIEYIITSNESDDFEELGQIQGDGVLDDV